MLDLKCASYLNNVYFTLEMVFGLNVIRNVVFVISLFCDLVFWLLVVGNGGFQSILVVISR